MQSQQKRVKWSRGETAEALEERTDTGITNASVELMENCSPDIFGNISRRPALKPIPLATSYSDGGTSPYIGFRYDKGLQVVPFYITEHDIILVGIHTHSEPEFLRIQNDKIISKKIASGTECWNGVADTGGVWHGQPISFAQQNNYMIIATVSSIWKIQFTLNNDGTFVPSIDIWKFSGGWYAPNGTQTKTVSEITYTVGGSAYNKMLSIKASSSSGYLYTDISGTSTDYTALQIGDWAPNSDGEAILEGIKETIPVGSIVRMIGSGAYMRIEGYFLNYNPFPDTTFDGVLNSGATVPSTGTYCQITTTNIIKKYIDGALVSQLSINFKDNILIVVKNTASSTDYSSITFHGENPTPAFASLWFQNVPGGAYAGNNEWAFGSLLTPIADNVAIDNVVNVEYGYESLMPKIWSSESCFPHPKKVVFNDQRLWAGDWAFSLTDEYSLVVGSQIARYNDLKNDYNRENEAITLDILTQFKERILHLVDYNGLKIMTDAYEYAYENGGVVKQSANGSLESCTPLVFDSLCLYVDSTGCQVKAMQYEFQSNIFNSSTINQVAPHDLVWFPVSMASFEDKTYNTGKYLFVVNTDTNVNPRLAVCNFVPSNQANIWNRWSAPRVKLNNLSVTTVGETTAPMVFTVVPTKNHPIFMITLFSNLKTYGPGILESVIYPASLDFEGNGDLVCEPLSDNRYAVINYVQNPGLVTEQDFFLTIPSVDIAVYSNGEFQFMTKTDEYGYIVGDLSELTNVTVGLPINSTIRSHPIDVGGKTKSIKKRIGKARMSVHNTEPGAITINDKTGYMNPAKDYISFYGVTGMKQEIRYTITNKNGAMFHLESLLMNIEYGTLIS